jgi:class 3 adenylate cyclase/tetratricopeptide (TPR) repeat protein
VVTAFFCDVTGSTALGEELDPEVLRGVLNRYFAEIRAIIERHGGTVEKFIGDAVMAVFGIPRVQEDDALRAVRAAAEIRERLPAVASEVNVALRFRTGINTGHVLMGEGESIAIGDAINVAARLEQTAEPGEIVIGEETLRLVRDAVEVAELGPLELKGKSEPVAAYRVVRVDPGAPGLARHLDVPLVGRRRELELLQQAWARTVEESRCHLLTLLGEAGVGKSRLVSELLSGIADQATVLRGRCLHYGEGITFWPLVEAVMPVGEPARNVLEHLSSGGLATPEELFWEVRKLLESLALERPVALYLDDMQWAEPMLLDLLDHVADLSRGAPILLMCTARPELLDDRPAWGGGKLTATTIFLEPLAASEAEALLDELGDGLDRQARERVIAASEGNPLFLEEMVALARERGTVEVPPTIQALLAARLERLGLEERELLERGAIEGEVFHRLAVRALASERLATEVELRLAGLVRKELIRPHPPTLKGDEAFRFRHLLIRDAAYDGLPKAARAELHERFAYWLEDAAAELLELDEIAGWHLEQAIRYRKELGRSVEPRLASRAVRHLHAAGRRAVGRSDILAAGKLLERALALAADDDPVRPQVAIELAEQLLNAGELNRAEELIAAAEQSPAPDPLVMLSRLDWMVQTDPQAALREIEARLPQLIERLTEAGDYRGLARAHLLSFSQHMFAAQSKPAGEQARLAAEYADRAGDDLLKGKALSWYITVFVFSPADARTIAREIDEIEQGRPGPYLQTHIALARGEVRRLEGEFEEALRLTEQAIEGLRGLGIRVLEAAVAQHVALIHDSAGDPIAAVPALRRADAVLEELGERGIRSTINAFLAWALATGGDFAAARAACDLADELTAPEDIVNFAITPRARARLALAEGDGERAEEYARTAVQNAFRTDDVFQQGAGQLELARVLAALGRTEEARSDAREALAIYKAKGDRPGAVRARAVLDAL